MQQLRGRLARPESSPADRRGELALCCAIILQAFDDLRRGDASAGDWLETTGREWCEVLFGLDVEGVDLRQLAGRVRKPHAPRVPASGRERARRYRAAHPQQAADRT